MAMTSGDVLPLTEEDFHEPSWSIKPQEKPPDWVLSVTTVKVQQCDPSKIGKVIDTFLTRFYCSMLKVDAKKSTITVEICIDYVICVVMNITVYQDETDVYAIKFLLLSGDTVVFKKVYDEAFQFLQDAFSPGLAPCILNTEPDESLHDESALTQANVTALVADDFNEHMRLLTMLDDLGLLQANVTALVADDINEQNPYLDQDVQANVTALVADDINEQNLGPDLQAEAANVLATLAAYQAQKLLNAAAFESFTKLIQCERENVTYPTACALNRLVKVAFPLNLPGHSAGQACFHKLMPIILIKVESNCPPEVKNELIDVVNHIETWRLRAHREDTN
jgi:hypothetical protein